MQVTVTHLTQLFVLVIIVRRKKKMKGRKKDVVLPHEAIKHKSDVSTG